MTRNVSKRVNPRWMENCYIAVCSLFAITVIVLWAVNR
jgi:hypothetical protein